MFPKSYTKKYDIILRSTILVLYILPRYSNVDIYEMVITYNAYHKVTSIYHRNLIFTTKYMIEKIKYI